MKKILLSLFLTAMLSAALLTGCGSSLTPKESLTPTPAEDAAAYDEADAAPQTQSEADKADPQPSAQTPAAENAAAQNAADAELSADSIGAVSFLPNEKGYSMVYGSNTLHAYFKRQNVQPGNGRLMIRRAADDAIVEEINLKDPAKCTVGEADSIFYLLGWDKGTHLIITLQKTPSPGELYYVTLEDGAFLSMDGTIRSRAILDKETWCYGVADYGVLPALPSGSEVYVGDVLTADILIRQPAVLAKLENYDENRVRFNEKEFEADGRLDIKIYQMGDDPFTVTFYNKNDDPLGSITLSYHASMPPEPEEEAPRKSVTNL